MVYIINSYKKTHKKTIDFFNKKIMYYSLKIYKILLYHKNYCISRNLVYYLSMKGIQDEKKSEKIIRKEGPHGQ